MDMTPESITAVVIFVVIYFLMMVYGIASYIMRSLSLYSIARRRGVSAYGLAWVPGLYSWALGGIADKHDGVGGKDHKWRVVLLTLCLIGIVLSLLYFAASFLLGVYAGMESMGEISEFERMLETMTETQVLNMVLPWLGVVIPVVIVVTLVAGANSVCSWICYYKLFETCKPEKPVKNLLVAILVPFAFPFVLLSCRKHDPLAGEDVPAQSLPLNNPYYTPGSEE